MENFDIVTFLIGFVFGILFLFVIVSITYFTRTGTYQYCQVTPSQCSKYDYYNNPSDAIQQGKSSDELLSIKDGKLMYDRMKIESAKCNPGPNKKIEIEYPMYCLFTDAEGNRTLWKDIGFSRNNYSNPDYDYNVKTNGNCSVSEDNDDIKDGSPVMLWD